MGVLVVQIKQRNNFYWMKKALRLAAWAEKKGEVPVGAILLDKDGKLLSVGINLRESYQNPLFHAEMVAISRASKKIKNWRLVGAHLIVTLEPCVMCAGAIVQSRIKNLTYGLADKKGGGVESLYSIPQDKRLNHRVATCELLESDESIRLLKNFFNKKRNKN